MPKEEIKTTTEELNDDTKYLDYLIETLKVAIAINKEMVVMENELKKKGMKNEFAFIAYYKTSTLEKLLDTITKFKYDIIYLYGDIHIEVDNPFKKELEKASKGNFVMGMFKTLNDAVYMLVKIIEWIGTLIITRTSRINEYRADHFALRCGYGVELTDVLIEIYGASISKPESVKEILKSAHPHVTLRIERLERKNNFTE
jgi:hypothetical protein